MNLYDGHAFVHIWSDDKMSIVALNRTEPKHIRSKELCEYRIGLVWDILRILNSRFVKRRLLRFLINNPQI